MEGQDAETLLRLLAEERRLREEQLQRFEETLELQRQQHEEQDRKLEYFDQPTTLSEYLDACHVDLYLGLKPGAPAKSTGGPAARPEGKFRPDHIREWLDFPDKQKEIWAKLMDIDFGSKRLFSPLGYLNRKGPEIRKHVRSELDLHDFDTGTVRLPLILIIENLYADPHLRQVFDLQGTIDMENHANTLVDEDEDGLPPPPAKLRKTSGDDATPTTPTKSSRPLADEFCVYNKGETAKVPAFVVEVKPPHKLQLGMIEAGLQDMDVGKLMVHSPDESAEIMAQRFMAGIITQPFSYMIQGGLEYAYICTGQTFIFLHIAAEDPTTIYYYLSVPEREVGDTTGFSAAEPGADNRLHLTAVGQVLAFTLQALRTPPHSQSSRNLAQKNLKIWDLDYEDPVEIPVPKIPSTPGFLPTRQSARSYIRSSPVVTREQRKKMEEKKQKEKKSDPSCKPSSDRAQEDDSDEDEEGYDPDSPSRRPRSSSRAMAVRPSASTQATKNKNSTTGMQGKQRSYCTQRCLLGLANGGLLDKACPNVEEHGTDTHQIDQVTFISLLEKQILNEDIVPESFTGCESLHQHGARGALFEVILMPYGYTLVGKGFPAEFRRFLEHEHVVYEHLASIQGMHIPVCLGTIDLSKRPLFYDGIAIIPRFLLLGHAGTPINDVNNGNDESPKEAATTAKISEAAANSLRAIHRLGVRHCDAFTRNIFWDQKLGKVLFIDFERAEICDERPAPLGVASLNRSPSAKRSRIAGLERGEANKLQYSTAAGVDRFDSELRVMLKEVRQYSGGTHSAFRRQ